MEKKPLIGGGAKESASEGFDRVQAELKRIDRQIKTGLEKGIPFTSEMEAHAKGLMAESRKLRSKMLAEIRRVPVPADLPPLPQEKKALDTLGKTEKQLKADMKKAEARAKAKASPARGGAKPKKAGGGAKPSKKK